MTTTTAATLRYFAEYPRDFANEYDVFAVESSDLGRFRELRPDAGPITRREAIRLGWSRPREAKRDGEQWFGGFHGLYGNDGTIEDAIRDCVAGTRRMMDETEAMRDRADEMRAELAAGN